MSSKHFRAASFEACCQWELLHVKMTTLSAIYIYCTEEHLSFCNHTNENVDILEAQVKTLEAQVNGPLTLPSLSKTNSNRSPGVPV